MTKKKIMTPDDLPNVRRKGSGWQAYPRVSGKLRTKVFPFDTEASVIAAWIEDQQLKYGGPQPTDDSLDADMRRYLAAPVVARMPSIKARTRHLLDVWLPLLGRQRRSLSVEPDDVNVILDDWTAAGMTPATIRRRCGDLQAFYTFMFPTTTKDAATNGRPVHSKFVNPVAVANRPKPPKYQDARGQDYGDIHRMLASMPEYRICPVNGKRPLNLSKICAAVIAYTGLPPGMLNDVQPHHLSLQGTGFVVVQERKKGGGVEPRRLPLTPDGLSAFKRFHAANAYGRVPSKLRQCVKAAWRRIGVDATDIRLYDLRHSFLTEMYKTTRDLATVGRLAMHAEGSPHTARYARAANEDVDAAAVQAFGDRVQARRQSLTKSAPAPVTAHPQQAKVRRGFGAESAAKLPAKVARNR